MILNIMLHYNSRKLIMFLTRSCYLKISLLLWHFEERWTKQHRNQGWAGNRSCHTRHKILTTLLRHVYICMLLFTWHIFNVLNRWLRNNKCSFICQILGMGYILKLPSSVCCIPSWKYNIQLKICSTCSLC
jgi:hypothetical protein